MVVFDRIREVKGLYPKRDRALVINDALNSTLTRTLNTSLSTAIVLLCIFILGGDVIRSFTFAMLFGVIVGTASTLFVATPIAYEIQRRSIAKRLPKKPLQNKGKRINTKKESGFGFLFCTLAENRTRI